MKSKKFLLTSVWFVFALFMIYLSIFYYQLGMPIRTEWWVKNCYQYKDYRAEEISGKKIIILSGSNGLFGINGAVLQKQLGYPVANLAAHVYLDIDFLFYKLKQHMKDGDIVILPLEFEHYSRKAKLSNWFTKNMMAWGQAYLAQLSLTQLLHFVVSTDPSTVLRTAIQKMIYGGKNTKLMSQSLVVQQVKNNNRLKNVHWRGYLPESLDIDGNFEVDRPNEYYKNKQYIPKDIKLSKHFVEIYKKMVDFVNKHHGKLYLTYPNMMKNIHFDLATQETRHNLETLKSELGKYDIKMICSARLFQMHRIFYFNNPYHPNKYGSLIYSYNLADCLKRHMDNPEAKDISYADAKRKTEILEKKYLNAAQKLGK